MPIADDGCDTIHHKPRQSVVGSFHTLKAEASLTTGALAEKANRIFLLRTTTHGNPQPRTREGSSAELRFEEDRQLSINYLARLDKILVSIFISRGIH